MPDETSSIEETPSAKRGVGFPVVGVGASAGGLKALTALLTALPVDTGMAFVIVQHLSPAHESILAELLSRATKMQVHQVSEEPSIEPNQVYVIPPGRDMIVAEGKLVLLPQERSALHRGIDQFFSSLAADCRHKAIGVVLSGAAADGTLGLEEIKAAGGITFAQDESAEIDSMPQSAVASGCVDFVLSPEEIAAEIARIAKHPYVAPSPESEPEKEAPGTADHIKIAELINQATGADFTHYKTNTLNRRISRRMLLHKIDSISDYEALLAGNPEEVQALVQDILINVTCFFRDPEAYKALAKNVFPKLLAGRTRQEPVRIWTLGCSTGEEAYSLAMVFSECAEAVGSDVPLQLFATDLNPVGVATARAGFYPKSITSDVSEARLERFFVEEAGGYRIAKSIRNCCTISRHNVLADPPFSRVDFISCRNLLIYMGPVLQQQIMLMLHYSLKPGGTLWLGSSETAGTTQTLFDTSDSRHKVYTRRAGVSPASAVSRPWTGGSLSVAFPTPPASPRGHTRVDLPKEAERILLTRYTPPGVVVSASLDILQFRGDTSPYLTHPAGTPSVNLLKMLREGLLVSVRSAIMRSSAEGQVVREDGLRVESANGFRNLTVEIVPIRSGTTKENGFLILFEETFSKITESAAVPDAGRQADSPNDDEVRHLTQELTATREYLQSVIEEQEAANEELQSANEEAQSANEEMQSVNEELETSKEEIQSSNEELATVNEELDLRSQEQKRLNQALETARDYAESIVASVRWPLIVLDEDMRVKTASRAFYEVFRVAPEATEGRRIYDLGNGQWNLTALRTLLEELLPEKESIENFEIRHTFEKIGPRVMLLNARRLAREASCDPLIILAIEDISDRDRAENALRESLEFNRSIIESSPDCIKILDLKGNLLSMETGMELLGIEDIQPFLNHSWIDLWRIEDRGQVRSAVEGAIQKGQGQFVGLFPTMRDEPRWWDVTITPILDATGRTVRLLAVSRDVTKRRELDKALNERAADLVQADRSKDEFLAMLAHELRNPLAPLRNAAEIMASPGAGAEACEKAQEILSRQVDNMTRMIEDLLDVSRITEG